MSHARGGSGRRLTGVLFDYGETLVQFVRPLAALARAHAEIIELLEAVRARPLTVEELRLDILDRVEHEVAEHTDGDDLREMSVAVASRRAYRNAGFDLDEDVLDEVLRIEQEAWWRGARLDPEAEPLLDALRGRGIRVGLCSNAPYRLRSLHQQLAFVGLDAHLDLVTFSAEIGWRKPSPRIFTAALRALGAEAATSLMVGDSERCDVAGAHRVGMSAVLMRRTGGSDATAADAVIASLAELPDAVRDMGLY